MEINDHDLLVSTHTMMQELYKVIKGNGRPGLLEKVTVLEDDMRRREQEAAELRTVARDLQEGAPSKRNKALVNSGVLTAVLISLFTAIDTIVKR